MQRILNISNGDCTIELMKQAGVEGDRLPWRDLLHEGPVPSGLSLQALSAVRAEYIASQGWGNQQSIQDDFIARDKVLASYRDYDRVVLWFEHDLYDQLQLIQLLDWFNHQQLNGVELMLICIDEYLAQLSPEKIAALTPTAEPVSEQQLGLATRAWAAFTHETPRLWYELLDQDTAQLPFLAASIRRQLEELPDYRNGLSRTEQQILSALCAEPLTACELFEKSQAMESARFMGDSSFWLLLDAMINQDVPYIETEAGVRFSVPPDKNLCLNITRHGQDVFNRRINCLDNIKIDRWAGGIHLQKHNLWCWNPLESTLINCSE